MNASVLLNKAFAQYWLNVALISEERHFTYAEMYAVAAGVVVELKRKGCQVGDAVALELPNGWALAIAYIACMLGGLIAVPIDPDLPEHQRYYIQQLTQPRLVIRDLEWFTTINPSATPEPAFDFPESGVAAIFFTSGTTGLPKGVCHCLDAMVKNVHQFNQSQGLDQETRMYHVLPMSYMAGFLNTLLSPWLCGGTVVLGARFRPAQVLTFWRTALALQANTLWLTPTIAAALARANRSPETAQQVGTQFRQIFCGTAPLSDLIRQRFREVFHLPLQESYGMSEILLVAAQTREQAELRNGVGTLLSGIEGSFRTHADSQAQELLIRTPYALSHYVTNQGVLSPLLPDGSMPTGDIAQLDANYLTITGRIKDLIIRGGLNISPASLENVLRSEAGIEDLVVIGVPHEFWGESLVVCLIAAPAVDRDELLKRLQTRCQQELAEGSRPDRYLWFEEFPRSSTGKIQKQTLRELIA